jgi:HSP20 family protein
MAISKVNSSMDFSKRLPPSGNREASSETYWVPNTDVYISDSGLVIKVELSGIRREDLEVVADGNRLKISGHRPDGSRGSKCRYLVMEINYGAFESVIEVPAGYDLRHARAVYQNGFLRIEMPAAAPVEHKPHSVPISTPED